MEPQENSEETKLRLSVIIVPAELKPPKDSQNNNNDQPNPGNAIPAIIDLTNDESDFPFKVPEVPSRVYLRRQHARPNNLTLAVAGPSNWNKVDNAADVNSASSSSVASTSTNNEGAEPKVLVTKTHYFRSRSFLTEGYPPAKIPRFSDDSSIHQNTLALNENIRNQPVFRNPVLRPPFHSTQELENRPYIPTHCQTPYLHDGNAAELSTNQDLQIRISMINQFLALTRTPSRVHKGLNPNAFPQLQSPDNHILMNRLYPPALMPDTEEPDEEPLDLSKPSEESLPPDEEQ